MTAGTIAREFMTMSTSCSDSDAEALRELASAFTKLVKDRNALFHGVPYTAERGEQRLLHLGPGVRRDWSESMIREAAREFEATAIQANGLLHAGRYEVYMSATGKSLSV